ncbi:MAG: hypothetical protein BIFFINMI_00911 [Phycisphaerae bacterium]|nr:hypothetical protein [Phycisphaerae bacterium]
MSWAELTDCRCFYELTGDGPGVLLIPGLGATARVWQPVVPSLAERFTLLTPDNRDMGRSLARRPVHTLRDYTADLVELLDHLGARRIHVVGMSLGGIIAHRLAADHPSRVERLVLISAASRFTPYLSEIGWLLGQMLRHFPRDIYTRTFELLGCGPLTLDRDPSRLQRLAAEELVDPTPRRALGRQLRALLASAPVDECQPIAAPTLVMSGRYDVLIPACYGRQLANSIRGARFVEIPQAGHNPVSECPDYVARAVGGFLADGRVIEPDPPASAPRRRDGPLSAVTAAN